MINSFKTEVQAIKGFCCFLYDTKSIALVTVKFFSFYSFSVSFNLKIIKTKGREFYEQKI